MTTILRTVASGATATFPVSYEYLDKSFTQVWLDGVLLTSDDFMWPDDGNITLTGGAPNAGALVERRRVTPAAALTSFSPGNLDSGDLNVADTQSRHIAEEGRDLASDVEDRSLIAVPPAHGHDLPAPAAGRALGWNSTGDGLANISIADQGAIALPGEPTENNLVSFGASAQEFRDSGVSVAAILASGVLAAGAAQKEANLSDLASLPDARHTLSVGVVVTSVDDLKALDPAKDNVAVLALGNGGGRGRSGVFLLGDYSAYSVAVTADTIGGFVVRSTVDDTKVWVRDAVDVRPEYFGAAADGVTDDYTPIATGIAVADALALPFRFQRTYGLGSTLTIPTTLRNVEAAAAASLVRVGSAADGVVIGGSPTRFGHVNLPSIIGFTGIGLTAKGGLFDCYVPQIANCGTALRITEGGGGSTIRNNMIGNCNLAIEFYLQTAAGNIQGSSVRGGFITNTPNIIKVNGASGACDGLIVEYDAIDVVTGGGVVFTNSLAVAVPRFTFKCPSWLGGNGFSAATKTQLFAGQWNNCDFDITNALAFNQSHMTPGQPAATRWKMRNQGSSGGFALAGSLAAFNGGLMLCQTEFMVKLTLAADLVAGGTVTSRFYHILADSNYYNWQMTKCAGPAGAVVGAYSDFNATEAGRVDITILNAGTTTIAAGTTIFIAVSRN